MVANRAKHHIFNKKDELRHFSANNDIGISLWSENISISNGEFFPPQNTIYRCERRENYGRPIIIAKKTVFIENTVLFTSQLFWQNIIVPKTNNISTSLSRIGSTQTSV